MRLVAAVAALLRRLRAERATVVLLFVLVAVTSGAVAAAPRLFSRVADDGLRYELAQGTAIQRNLEFGAVDPLPASPGGDPLSAVAAAGETLRDGLAPPVRSLIDETRFVVDSARFNIDEAPVLPTFVTFREADGIKDLLALADGRWPARVLPPETPDPAAPPAFEIALSTAAAERVGLSVGDSLTAKVDIGDPLLRRRFPTPEVAVRIELVGTFTVADPGAHVWFDDPALGAVTIGGTEDEPVAFATGLIAPAAYADVIALGLPTRNRWRLFVDPDRLDAGQLDTLVGALRQLKLRYSTTTPGPGVTVLNTGLLAGVERFLAQRATTETMLSLAALGPLAAAAGALGLFAILVVQRRRPALALARGRGASSGQLLATQLWEGLLITVPAALLGLAVAIAVVPARSSDLSSVGALTVALGATVILLIATWPVARRARRDLERDTPPAVRISARRFVFEALVVGLSLSAAWLLRERGLAGAEPQGATAATATFDPFLGASPVLIGVAVALLTIRFYPLPVQALGWSMARRRDLVPVLGLRALGRQPSVGSLPLLVLMLTLAIGTFSSVLLASIEHGQAATALQEVGADFRVVAPLGTAFPDAAAVRSLAGVEAVAAATSADALLSTDPRSLTAVRALAIEPAAYDAVLAGTPGAAHLSTLLADTPTGSAGGTSSDPIPAIVSTRLSDLAVGDRFDLVLVRPEAELPGRGAAGRVPGDRPRYSIRGHFLRLGGGRLGGESTPSVDPVRPRPCRTRRWPARPGVHSPGTPGRIARGAAGVHARGAARRGREQRIRDRPPARRGVRRPGGDGRRRPPGASPVARGRAPSHDRPVRPAGGRPDGRRTRVPAGHRTGARGRPGTRARLAARTRYRPGGIQQPGCDRRPDGRLAVDRRRGRIDHGGRRRRDRDQLVAGATARRQPDTADGHGLTAPVTMEGR